MKSLVTQDSHQCNFECFFDHKCEKWTFITREAVSLGKCFLQSSSYVKLNISALSIYITESSEPSFDRLSHSNCIRERRGLSGLRFQNNATFSVFYLLASHGVAFRPVTLRWCLFLFFEMNSI